MRWLVRSARLRKPEAAPTNLRCPAQQIIATSISRFEVPGANGVFTGTLTGLDPASRTTPGNFILYLVDGTQGIAIETDNAQLALARLVLAH